MALRLFVFCLFYRIFCLFILMLFLLFYCEALSDFYPRKALQMNLRVSIMQHVVNVFTCGLCLCLSDGSATKTCQSISYSEK